MSTGRERHRTIDARSTTDDASGARTLAPARPATNAQDTTGTPRPLRYQRCCWCNTALSAIRLLCTTCGAVDLTCTYSAGYGTAVRLMSPSRRTGAPAHDCLVALDEGFTLRARVNGLPGVVRLGSRVRLEETDEGGGSRFLVRLLREEHPAAARQ